MSLDLSAKLAALGNRVSSVEARQYSLNPNDILYSAIGEGTLFGCKVTQGVSATDMIVALEGQAVGDESNWNPDYTASPERGYQYANIASGKDGAIRLQDTTATAENAPATGTARIDIAYMYVGPNGAGFAIETGTPSVGTKTDFDTYGLDTAGYGLARLADPDLPVGALPVARIYVSDTVTGIPNARIADLRPQIGGAFGSMALQDANNVAITGGTISVSALTTTGTLSLANGTAAAPAARFTSDTDTGLFRSAANVLGIAALGAAAMLFTNPASAVNYWQVNGSPTATQVGLAAQGTDATVHTAFTTKGGGAHYFCTNNFAALQLLIANANSAVNYAQVQGASTGNFPVLSAQGSDANIGFILATKGTGAHYFQTGGSINQLVVANTSAAVNYWQFTGSTTGNSVSAIAAGSDANIGMGHSTKGTGGHSFYTNGAFSAVQFVVSHTASSVNYLNITGAVTTGTPVLSVLGSDTNVNMQFNSKGTGLFRYITSTGSDAVIRVERTAATASYIDLIAGNGATAVRAGGAYHIALQTNGGTEQFRVAHTGSAVDFIQVTGGTAGNPILTAAGASADVSLILRSKGVAEVALASGGTGPVSMYTNLGTLQARATHTTSAVNYWQFTGSTTTNSITLSAQGSDANVGINIDAKGTGAIVLRCNSLTALRVIGAVSAVNYMDITAAATGGNPWLSAQGADAAVGFRFSTKGAGAYSFQTGGGSEVTQVGITHTASAVNYVNITGSATGNYPIISSVGSDTNIGLDLISKGTGDIRLRTNGSPTQLLVGAVASAVNYVIARGAITTGFPSLAAGGTDTNIQLDLISKGTGSVGVQTGGGYQLAVISTASAVNYGTVTGSATGTGVVFGAGGSDANIDIRIVPKGTGVINLSATVAAAAAVASTHKVTVKVGGTTYYLLATNVP
jgi:hypothetical protein